MNHTFKTSLDLKQFSKQLNKFIMRQPMKLLFLVALVFSTTALFAQQNSISHMRPYDQSGLNYFEDLKSNEFDFKGVKVRIGGNFAQQFQGLSHSNTDTSLAGVNALYDLKPGFNLATANLNIDVQLADGVRLNLITYLSSKHHPESWVKGGYIQFDKLPFASSLDELMENFTVRVGHMEVNYGDAHFRRTDNGNAIYNPFVGNYIVDAFNTEIGGEIQYKNESGLLGVLSITGSELNGNVTSARTSDNDDKATRAPSIIGKLGYDKALNDNTRIRLTGSMYYTASSAVNHIFDGDRGGSRYNLVLSPVGVGAGDRGIFTSGRYSPGFLDKVTSYMVNGFVKTSGFEFFGTYETANGRNWFEADTRNMNQIAADALYRFGKDENFYLGARYNLVNAEDVSGADITINRVNGVFGWFVTKNVLFKIEYVNQNYEGFPGTSILRDGNFNGAMIEAVVGF